MFFSISYNVFANTDTIALNSTDSLKYQQTHAKVVTYNGHEAIQVIVNDNHKSIEEGGCDGCTYAIVPTKPFKNGIIEIEVAGKPSKGAPEWNRGFVGIVFRIDEQKNQYEGVYLRPENAISESQLQRNHSVQYFSFPNHQWHHLRESDPGKYESYADIKPAQWTKMKIVVEDEKMRLFLNDNESPTLIVNDMKGGADLEGGIGLFTESQTDAFFRNLKITYQ